MPRAARKYVQTSQPSLPKRTPAARNSRPSRKQVEGRQSNKLVVQPFQDYDNGDKHEVIGRKSRTGGALPEKEVSKSDHAGDGNQTGSASTRAARKGKTIRAMERTQHLKIGEKVQPNDPATRYSQRTANQEWADAPAISPASALAERPTSAQPTRTRENSILDGIGRTKRRDSILRLPGLDDTSPDFSDDSFALPDHESTPLTRSRRKAAPTPRTPSLLMKFSSKKRKRGSPGRRSSAMLVKLSANLSSSNPSPEPALPPFPLPTLDIPNQKQLQEAISEDDDVLALPMSSSSPISPSTSKAATVSKPPTYYSQSLPFSTEQLQALMSTKRRKVTRNGRQPQPKLDVPDDYDSSPDNITESEGDSTFLPITRRIAKGKGTRHRDKDKLGPGDDEVKVLVARSDDGHNGGNEKLASPEKKKRVKWHEIDAWNLDFEDIDTWEGSSEENAR